MTPNDPLSRRVAPPPTEADDCPSGTVVFFVFVAILAGGFFSLGYMAGVWGWV